MSSCSCPSLTLKCHGGNGFLLSSLLSCSGGVLFSRSYMEEPSSRVVCWKSIPCMCWLRPFSSRCPVSPYSIKYLLFKILTWSIQLFSVFSFSQLRFKCAHCAHILFGYVRLFSCKKGNNLQFILFYFNV